MSGIIVAIAIEWTKSLIWNNLYSPQEIPEAVDPEQEYSQDEGLQSLPAEFTQALATSIPRPSRSLLKSPNKLQKKNFNKVRFVDSVGLPLTKVKWIEAVGRGRPVGPRKSHTKRGVNINSHRPAPAQTPTSLS